MPSVKVVNGKQIVVEHLGPIERVFSVASKPFVRVWQHRDLVAAILRREVRERFKGSIAGWIWAIMFRSVCRSAVGLPLISVTMSPTFRPALSAGLPSYTSLRSTPAVPLKPYASAVSLSRG